MIEFAIEKETTVSKKILIEILSGTPSVWDFKKREQRALWSKMFSLYRRSRRLVIYFRVDGGILLYNISRWDDIGFECRDRATK